MELDFEEEGGTDPRLAATAAVAMVPSQGGEGVVVTQETTRRMAVHRGQAGDETKQQLSELARTSAAAHHAAVEQINQVRRQQGEIAAKTSEYLQQQYDQQLDLKQQQEDIRKQMDEQRQHLQEQFRLLKAAEEAMGRQERQIEDLAEAVRPHIEARWGLFAESSASAEAEAARSAPEPTVMLATGANMPVPPMYRGSTKKEKREFMDSYMVYKRRVDALNQGTQTRVFIMPLGACIEQGTLVRVCRFELFKNPSDVTEDDWKAYFLEARRPDFTAYKKLQQAVRSLAMDVGLNDASSRLSKLLADFYDILDDLNMEDIIHEDPKTVVDYLANALRPSTFKATIKDYLSRPPYKPVKRDVQVFLKWLKPQLEEFMKYEAHIPLAAPATSTSKPQAQQASGTPRVFPKPAANANKAATATSQPARSAPDTRTSNEKKFRPTRPGMKAKSHACFKCGDLTHGVFQCPDVANAQEAKAIYEQRTGRKVVREVPVSAVSHSGAAVSEPLVKRSPIPAQVNGLVDTAVTLDSGAGVTLIRPELLEKLRATDCKLIKRKLENPGLFEGVGGSSSLVHEEFDLDFKFDTPGGPLVLRRVKCWVGTLPEDVGEVLLADEVMARLGYDPVQLLAHAQRRQSEYDFAVPVDLEPNAAPAKAAAIGLQPSPEEKELEDIESKAYFPSAAATGCPSDDEVAAALRQQVQEVRIMDAPPVFIDGLEILLTEMVRAFALVLGKLPPVDMPPMEIKLKPGAKPFRCRARRYSREHRDFLARHVKELLDTGLCYRNPSSRWCSPPLVINKPGIGNFRMTVDVRGPNEQVEPTVWPMPILEVEFDRLRGAKYYFSLDFLQSFWQFGTAPSCQEIYSILTEEGVITPTRVLMGGTNSVAHVQSTVQAMFADVHNKGLLIWIDDLLGYSATAEGLLALLRKVLTICVKRGLKLNPRKCKFFLREAKWCGRVVSGDGVKHDPERIAALQALSSPVTGQQLQQFVCALNWMRMSIPAYNKLVEPLTTFLEKVYTAGGGRKKANVRGVQLATIGWGAEEEACLEACRGALQNALQLAHPDPEKRLCVFTDASDLHWGAAITQVPHEHLSREFSEQHHEPLMMISGTFSGAAKRWAIVEKEAYAIVETCKRADYLVQRADGFLLFTDHRNLRFIFAPTTVMASVPKYTADKLHRWSLILMGFRYEIHDIAGDSNVWADLLSRWGSSFTTVCAIRHTVFPVSPQLDSTFEWPTSEPTWEASTSRVPKR